MEDTTDQDCYITVSSKVLKINPSDNTGETITATLENGGILDAQDFVWWADDYNIVSISSITDTCQIVPTGVSGTTYVHVKHPKVVTTVDILVMCSEYTEFAFKYVSKEILEKSILFVPMEVPATSEEAWIEYSSSDNNVVVATGSNQVCMIAGVMKGSATVNATLKTANGTIGTTQMAVIVNQADTIINTISMNSTVINMEIGESKTLEALLSGNEIATNDYYNLEWSLTSNENSCVSLLQNEAGKTTGKNSYITAKAGGTAVLNLSHPKCSYDLTVWIIVPEKEETDISLTQTYIEMYKSDGSTTVTAKLINGATSDASTVTWTAPKVGGVNIVSISKSNGLTCNIIPRNVGSTTLRAQLPNGNYADCIVTVLTDAEIVLETKTVHVNPGFTETVSYTVTPENATINWIEMMNSSSSFGNVDDFFDFSVNESTKTITITGKELGSGTLYGYSANDSGTAKAQLSVICEYNYELEFDYESGILTMIPDDSGKLTTKNSPHNLAEIPFHVYPKSGMELEVSSSDPAIEITSYSFDSSTGKGIIYVKALTEETGGYITLTATNPNDKINTPITRKKYINSKYSKYTINPVFNFEAGSFSSYKPNENNGCAGTLHLGDGENYLFYLDVAEPNAKLENIKITYNAIDNGVDTQIGKKECSDEDDDQYNNGKGKDQPHIYFTGSKINDTTGILTEETTDENGVKYYRIGHNYDYTTKGYWTKGDCKKIFNVYYYETVGEGYTYNPFNWDSHWNHHQTNILHTSDGEKRTSSNDLKELLQNGVIIVDSNVYYYNSQNFTGYPYWYKVQEYHCSSGCSLNHNFRNALDASILPTYIGETVCKDVDTKEDFNASLIISYQTVEHINSSDSEKVTVKIIVEKRNCPNNIKNLWKQTQDSNGKTCWKYLGNTSDFIGPFIGDKYYFQDANVTKYIQLNSNCILSSSNTNITISNTTPDFNIPENTFTCYVNNIEKTYSSIDVKLGSNNILIIKTGPKANCKFTTVNLMDSSDIKSYNYDAETTSTITITYSKNGKTCSGKITVNH